MTDLKLGPLQKVRYVRKTVLLPEPLNDELEAYAAEHSRIYEPVEAVVLIPLMLKDFLRTDRGWRSRRAKIDSAAQRPASSSPSRRSDPET